MRVRALAVVVAGVLVVAALGFSVVDVGAHGERLRATCAVVDDQTASLYDAAHLSKVDLGAKHHDLIDAFLKARRCRSVVVELVDADPATAPMLQRSFSATGPNPRYKDASVRDALSRFDRDLARMYRAAPVPRASDVAGTLVNVMQTAGPNEGQPLEVLIISDGVESVPGAHISLKGLTTANVPSTVAMLVAHSGLAALNEADVTWLGIAATKHRTLIGPELQLQRVWQQYLQRSGAAHVEMRAALTESS